MTDAAAAEFVRSLGRYLSVARLYGVDHPTRENAGDEAYEHAGRLLQGGGHATFSFLPDRVIHGDSPLDELDDWPWSERLADAGVQRLEISPGLRREELEEVLRALAARLARARDVPSPDGGDGALGVAGERGAGGDGEPAGEGRPAGPEAETAGDEGPEPEPDRTWRHARFGTLGTETKDVSREGTFVMEEEAEAVEWIHRMAEREGRIPVQETLALVRSLAVAMRGAHRIVVPFVRLKETDQYTAAHCINVAILSMSLAESMDFPPVKTRAIGAAGLLHDVGKMSVPSEILNKPGELDEDEWLQVKRHPVEGARILLQSGRGLDLPATVAYEHHVGWQRGGYPELHYERQPLPESRLVQVCDFYDALRTRRHYREPVEPARVVRILKQNEGEGLDPQYVHPFTSLIERWDPSSVLTEVLPDDRAADPAADGGEDGDGAGEAVETPQTLP